ncbi:MAG: pyridine nucleotide-disulfide oxidoreductase [Sulfobacillus benefaciens]|uniref:Pyridine nucleotide-disulfide oxidoreductase n=1 Tax=Sulfobacillus benefaciens TaxID=453960 RepID=A0A2T2XC14_9FIRM|nr:MAG: pyridine nucleotide-disulfide oxidoreductase [Sulfobacillus benefaciens]
MSQKAPHVVVLGANFAGLEVAQQLHHLAGDAVRITVMDQKSYLLFVPNIGLEALNDRDPAVSLHMSLPPVLNEDKTPFIMGKVEAIDVDAKRVDYLPNERPGAAPMSLTYDYLVIALGNRLAYDQIPGFAEFGHTVTDTYYGNRLRQYLFHEYKGGPVAVGSARFHQGTQTQDLVPTAEAACEGPPVEMGMSMGSWLKEHGFQGPEQVTIFTPAEVIAEDVGTEIVDQLLSLASKKGYHYMNRTRDIKQITADGIEFDNGASVEAELKIIFPDWVPHPFLQGLPISDDRGFIITDRNMRNPKYPNVLAAGDASALAVPKLGWIAHLQAAVVARQIAMDVGQLSKEEGDLPFKPSVNCIGDMGHHQAFYINSDAWYGGKKQVIKTGNLPYLLKNQYKDLFFRTHGKVPNWGMPLAEFVAEKL